jgi:hypothetical protein
MPNPSLKLIRQVLEPSESVTISENEFIEIRAAKRILVEAVFLEEKFDVVVENYLELETCFLDATSFSGIIALT